MKIVPIEIPVVPIVRIELTEAELRVLRDVLGSTSHTDVMDGPYYRGNDESTFQSLFEGIDGYCDGAGLKR